jgi:type I thyroxine 5'-deiodinase
MESNVQQKVVFASPKSLEERQELAGSCVRQLHIPIPALLDGLDNTVERAYTGWPDRLYLIDRQGLVVYKSKPGPFGFHASELNGAVETLLKGNPK